MKILLKTIWAMLLYLWQLPQNLVGLLFLLVLRKKQLVHKQDGRQFYVARAMRGAISLGRYIILSENNARRKPVYDHEYGHTVDSRKWGWLYLPVIGLCSGLHCLLYDRTTNYYDYWTERRANRFGRIEGYAGEYEYEKAGRVRIDITDMPIQSIG